METNEKLILILKGEKKMKETIVAVDRNHLGKIISLHTSSGRIISYQKAIQEINDGSIYDVILPMEQYSTDYDLLH